MRTGILIIGSLYWDQSDVRHKWRQDRLDLAQAAAVRAPIRYGRRSGPERGHTYTMVFSMACSAPEALGTALVVPTRSPCNSATDILEEAKCLWRAESPKGGTSGIGSDWGMVCALMNPGTAEHSALQGWSKAVADTNRTPIDVAAGESAVVDHERGLALFEWPTDLNGQPLRGFDLLLMTANAHRPSDIRPDPQTIAQRWLTAGGDRIDYFHNNRREGITTYQDDEIIRILKGEVRPGPSDDA